MQKLTLTSGDVLFIREATPDDAAELLAYRSCGFVIEGTLARDLCVNGQYFDHHFMARDVFSKPS